MKLGDSLKNKRGFTLAEILGVVVVIGLLLTLIAPAIISRIGTSKNKAKETGYKLVYMATSQHIAENKPKYPSGKNYCIKISDLIKEGKLSSPVKEIDTGKTIDDYSVLVHIFSTGNEYYEIPTSDDECQNEAILPMIDFVVSPLNNVWSKEKVVTIKYPDNTTDMVYKKNDSDFTNYSNPVKYTENGKISARAIYNNQVIESKIDILNIDGVDPNIQFVDKKCHLRIEFSDSGGSMLKEYAITDNENIPSTWKSLAKSYKQTLSNPNISRNQYVYVRDGALNQSHVKYAPTPYTLSFNLNGGTSAKPANQTVYNYENYNQNGNLPIPSRNKYIFDGWYTSASGGTKIENNTKVCLSSNQTLYAHWKSVCSRTRYVPGNWGNWSACSKTCGTGTRSRTRTISIVSDYDGSSCTKASNSVNSLPSASESQDCNTHSCCFRTKYVAGKWSNWSACSKTCGTGTKSRTRKISIVSDYDGSSCTKASNSVNTLPSASESQDCNTQCCTTLTRLKNSVTVCPTDSSIDGWDRDCHKDTHFNTMYISSVSVKGTVLTFHIKLRANTKFGNSSISSFLSSAKGSVCLSTGSSCTYTVKSGIRMANWANNGGVPIDETLSIDLCGKAKGKYYVIFVTGGNNGPYASFTRSPSVSKNTQIVEIK